MRKFKIESAPSEGSLHKVNIIGSFMNLTSSDLSELKVVVDETLASIRAIEKSAALRPAK